MDYATLDDLVRVSVSGWPELAQRAARDARITAPMLRTVATGGDTAGFPADLVAVAAEGVEVLRDQIAAASRHADTFLANRYPGGLTAEQLAASDLSTVVATIAWRRMFGPAVDETVLKATKWADDYLRDVANGVVSLGAAAASGPDESGEVLYHFSRRTVTDDDIAGFA